MANYESFNLVELTGRLVEIESRTGVTKKGILYIGGVLKVETSEDNIIPVRFFAQETTVAGKPSEIYKSLGTVISDFKTVQDCGIEEADIIEVSGGRVEENIFFPTADRMIRGFQIGSPFFRRKANADFHNEFTVSGEILDVIEEVKKEDGDDVPTGHLIVRLLVVGWNNRPNIIDFKVEDEAGIQYVKSSFNAGLEVKLNGKVVIDETIEMISEPVAFGEPIERTRTRTERKLLVTSATAPIDSTIPADDKAKMLAVREGNITVLKDEASNKNKTTSTKGSDFSL